jgi:hypothetical protein
VSKAAASAAAAAATAAANAKAQADALLLNKEYKAALEPVRLEILPLLETSGRSSALLMAGAKAAGPGGTWLLMKSDLHIWYTVLLSDIFSVVTVNAIT